MYDRALYRVALPDGPRLALGPPSAGPEYLLPPEMTLDGLLSHLTETLADGNVQVRAMVEFAMRREQELRGVLSGAATSFGSGQTISDQGRRRLQDDAVDGAVQSALRGADTLLGAVR